MEFAIFSDDFFETEESEQKEQTAPESSWTAHRSEPGWFHEVCERACESDVSFSMKHLRANHLYFTGSYTEAVCAFTELVKLMRTGNHQREVAEGLARSLLKLGDTKLSLEAATQLKLSCKSEAHIASYHILCAEIYKRNCDHSKELIHLQQAIKIHSMNTDMWLKIAECYSQISRIDPYAVPFTLSKTKDATWFAAASLLRVEIILKSLVGRESGGALKKKRNQKLQNRVHPVVASLPPIFISKAHEALCRDVFNLEFPTQDESEFVDLGSSKLDKTGENEESVVTITSERQGDWFEKQWFSFADSIQDVYCVPKVNMCDA